MASATAQAAKPFIASAFKHSEPFFDSTVQLSATSQFIGPISVVPYGYLRRVFMLVTSTGAGTGGVLSSALPAAQAGVFALQNIDFHDVNGASIIQNLNGFDLYLANRFGYYEVASDMPDVSPAWGAMTAASGAFSFGLYVPFEISKNGLGCLANQDSAAKYQMSLTIAPASSLFATNPSVLPNIRIRLYADCWSQPYATDIFGRPQTQSPPLIGTTQFLTKFQKNVNPGLQTIDLERRGAYIRNLIIYLTGGTSVGGYVPLDMADYPDPLTMLWDGQIVRVEGLLQRQTIMAHTYPQWGIPVPTGVAVYGNQDDTAYGDDNGALWYPTLTSTNLQLQGTFGGGASPLTLNILTNDVAIPQTSNPTS
jgi:hypothetical protein